MSLQRRLLILLAFFYSSNLLSQGGITWQQAMPICDPNATNNFTTLPEVEDYDRNIHPGSIEPCDGYYSFNLNNPDWYTIQATSSTISMDISTGVCVEGGHGTGVQFALVEIIDDNPVPISCNTDGNVGANINFTVGGLTIGRTYYLVIDGFAQSVCEYRISNSSGFDNPDITESIDNILVNDQLGSNSGCRVNGFVKLSALNSFGNPISNANIYRWEITSVSGNGFVFIETNSKNRINISNIPPGDYEVAIRPGNSCDENQPWSRFNFTVQENPIIELDFEEVCIDDLSESFLPKDPRYIGNPLRGLPDNPSRDTFYVEIPGGSCPNIQLIPLEFINGNNTPTRSIDTTTCSPTGVMINGRSYPPRAVGSSPYFISQGGACANTIELNVTLLFADGEIVEEKCNTGFSTISFNPYFPENFIDVKQFASYTWFDENGIVVSNEPTFPVNVTGSYSLRVSLQGSGNNPPCEFDIPALFVDVSGLSDLDVECDAPTANSISIQWNDIQDIDSYAIGVDGRIVEENLTNTTFTYNDISVGETATFFVFAVGNDPNCPPLMDSISCQALDCPPVDLVISNVGVPDDESLSICLDEDSTVLADNLQFEVTRSGGAGGGRGRWLISTGGDLGPDDESDQIIFNPNEQAPGEYVLSYRYQEDDCRFRSENVRYIEIIRQPISTNLRRRGRLDIDDGVCINDVLRLDYNGRAGSNARAVWGGDITNADVTGDLDSGFEMTFTTVGTKNFTFMVMDDNGCNSLVAPYSIEVGQPLTPQTINCNSTAAGMEFSWADQDCIEEYQIFVNGRFETRVTDPFYVYTRAVNGNSYSLEVEAISACGCDQVDFSSASPCMYTFDACESVIVALSSDNDKFCNPTATATLIQIDSLITGDTATGFGSWREDSGNSAISESGQFDPVLAGPGIHEIILDWTEGNCIYSDSISLSISDPDDIDFGISYDDPLCLGETQGTLFVNPVGGSGDYEVFLDVDPLGSFVSEFLLDPGSHDVIVIDTMTGCDTLAVFVINPGPDSIKVFRDTPYLILDGGDFTQSLDTTAVMVVDSIKWFYNDELVCENLSCAVDFNFNPTESGELCYQAYYNGCEAYTECALIDYFPDFEVYVPNVISLAADALPENRIFSVFTNDDGATFNRLLIFDRWGNQVYENNSESSNMEWNPVMNSKECSVGVYAYLIEIMKSDGKLEKRSGTISVIK